jgi:predicted PhzF superfamily epimerase YddE/YHI9
VNVSEDPVCGSGNAAVAAFLGHADLLGLTGRSYIAHQGHELGRKGVVHVLTPEDGSIEIGGSCITCVDGVLGSALSMRLSAESPPARAKGDQGWD